MDVAVITLVSTDIFLRRRPLRDGIEPGIPYAALPDIADGPLVEKVGDLLQLAPARAGIVEQVAELAGIWLDVGVVLLELWITLQDQDLVLGATALAHGVHRSRGLQPAHGSMLGGMCWC